MTEPTEILIHQVRYCQAKTKTGKQCSNRICYDRQYCPLHIRLFKFPKPAECPICTDSLDNISQPLSCGHWVHKSCVLKWKDQCPVCRAKIRLTKRERAILPKITSSPSVDMDDAAITALIRQDMEGRGISTDRMIFHEMEDMDLLSSLVVSHIIGNLTSTISTASGQLSRMFALAF